MSTDCETNKDIFEYIKFLLEDSESVYIIDTSLSNGVSGISIRKNLPSDEEFYDTFMYKHYNIYIMEKYSREKLDLFCSELCRRLNIEPESVLRTKPHKTVLSKGDDFKLSTIQDTVYAVFDYTEADITECINIVMRETVYNLVIAGDRCVIYYDRLDDYSKNKLGLLKKLKLISVNIHSDGIIFPSLKSLTLNSVTKFDFTSVSKLKKLKMIVNSVYDNPEFPETIKKLKYITLETDLFQTYINVKCSELRKVYIGTTGFVDFGNLSKLKCLSLSNIEQYGDSTPTIGEFDNNIRKLVVYSKNTKNEWNIGDICSKSDNVLFFIPCVSDESIH